MVLIGIKCPCNHSDLPNRPSDHHSSSSTGSIKNTNNIDSPSNRNLITLLMA
jgi:hypothetical protein